MNWTRRRGIRLADLMDEPWVLPPLDTLTGSIVVEAFQAHGLDVPAAVDDAYAATCFIAEHARAFLIDPRRLAVGGDSIGGGLATIVCRMARDGGGPAIALQLLLCPVMDLSKNSESRIALDRELSYRSKLDRRPELLDELREYGKTKCRWFLKEREAKRPPMMSSSQQSTAV